MIGSLPSTPARRAEIAAAFTRALPEIKIEPFVCLAHAFDAEDCVRSCRISVPREPKPWSAWVPFMNPEWHAMKHEVLHLALSKTQVAVGRQQSVHVYDRAKGEAKHRLQPLENGVSAVQFSPDAKWLAAAAKNADLLVWDAATGREHVRAEQQGGAQLCFSATAKHCKARQFTDVEQYAYCRNPAFFAFLKQISKCRCNARQPTAKSLHAKCGTASFSKNPRAHICSRGSTRMAWV